MGQGELLSSYGYLPASTDRFCKLQRNIWLDAKNFCQFEQVSPCLSFFAGETFRSTFLIKLISTYFFIKQAIIYDNQLRIH